MKSQTSRKWPDVVEIEVNHHCNRRCEYCPNSLPDFDPAASFMEVVLYRRIIDMLGDIGFTGRLSFHFFNEPLIRRDLEDLVAWARQELPRAYFVLYTNGDFLTDYRYEQLLKSGIDLFFVTRHSWDTFPARPLQRVQLPNNFPISSRGGSVIPVIAPLDIPCYGPSEMMIVTVNGDVVLCHEDAFKAHVMGNLARQSLAEVWMAPEFESAREHLEIGYRTAGPRICSTCDNRLYPLPGVAI